MKEDERIDSPLTGLEIQNAEERLISHVQEVSFLEEITASKQHGPVKDTVSNLANLNPFMCLTSRSFVPQEEFTSHYYPKRRRVRSIPLSCLLTILLLSC